MANPNSASNLVVFTVLFLFIVMIISYYVADRKYHNEKGTHMPLNVFLRGVAKTPTWSTILYGLVFGMIFGFLDNFFIYIGIDALEQYLPGDDLVKAGLGNTYSDVVGAIGGTYIQNIMKNLYGFDDDDVPIWVNTVGMFIGCLLGIYIPAVVLKPLINKFF